MPRNWTGATWRHLKTAPGSLALATVSTTQINLTWTLPAGSMNPKGTSVERSLNGSTGWAEIARVGATATAYSDTGRSAGTRYYYRVRQFNNNGYSPYSSTANTYTLPAAVGTVTIVSTSTTVLDLSWAAVTGATGYKVEQSADGATGWAQVDAPASNASTISGLTVGTRYYFRVRATDPAGDGAYSAVANRYTLPAKVGVVTPTVISATEIDLAWSAITSATSYIVERSLNGTSGWTTVGTPATNSFNNTGLTTATQYFYRVSAVNPGGTGATSDVVDATTS